jgi:hypothetical protein
MSESGVQRAIQCGAGPGTDGGLRASEGCAAMIHTNPEC